MNRPLPALPAQRPITSLALLLTAIACAVASTLFVIQERPAQAADNGSFAESKKVARTHLIDGKDVEVDSRTVKVEADSTRDLRDRQGVNITWSGAHPSGGIYFDANSQSAPYEEYPMVILQCRGVDSTSVPLAQRIRPETCFTQTPDLRYQPPYRSSFPAYRVDRYETASNRQQNVGVPNPLPKDCPTGDGAQRWVPFKAADGTTYPGGGFGCGGLAPEQSVVSDPLNPSNATFATTTGDGTGSARFIVQDGEDNASLGCSTTVACSLVVIPIEGISCDPSAQSLPPADRPSDVAAAQRECTQTGYYRQGVQSGDQNNSDPFSQLAVNGLLWWSASNWRNRITIPVSFAKTSAGCPFVGGPPGVGVYGSQYMLQAVQQWAPATCADGNLFKLSYTQTSEVQAKNLLAYGVTGGQYLGVKSVFQAGPPATAFPNPVAQAPTALTGFAIGYSIDDGSGREYTNLRLNARLLAKLLSMSYPAYPAIKNEWASSAHEDYNPSANNPLDISVDPEFLALNPGAKTRFISQLEASATLFAMSSDSDVMTALTSYINADPEARAFLDGKPDPWGMVVNPSYKRIALPVTSWPLLDTLYNSLGNPCIEDGHFPVLPLIAGQLSDPSQITFNAQLGINNAQVKCVVTGQTDSADSRRLAGIGREQPGKRFLLSVVSLADAQRYQINTAALQSHDDNPINQQFTDGSGRTFVGPSKAAILKTGRLMKPDDNVGTWPIPYDTLRASDAGRDAYPGTMLMSTDVPTIGLSGQDPASYAKLLRFIAGPGQLEGTENGKLAAGYVPITSSSGLSGMHDYTVAAARAVQAQQGFVPKPSDPNAVPPQDRTQRTSPKRDEGNPQSNSGNSSTGGGGSSGDAPKADASQGNGMSSSAPPPAATKAPAATPNTAPRITATGKTSGISPGFLAAIVPTLAIIALVCVLLAAFFSGIGRRTS